MQNASNCFSFDRALPELAIIAGLCKDKGDYVLDFKQKDELTPESGRQFLITYSAFNGLSGSLGMSLLPRCDA